MAVLERQHADLHARRAGVASRALTALSVWALGEAGFHRLHLHARIRGDEQFGSAKLMRAEDRDRPG